MRRLLFFLLFISTFTFAFRITTTGRPRDAYRRVCELTALHYYQSNSVIRDWIDRCRLASDHLPRRISNEQLLDDLQSRMDELQTSHFTVYAPEEDHKVWTGEAVHTGIRSRYVDGHLVVYRVLADSAAERALVKPGDEITSLPGVDEVSPAGAATRAGAYGFKRGDRTLKINIIPTPLQISGAPYVEHLAGEVSVLTIPSFRAPYFDGRSLQKITRQLASRRGVIVDLRENSGGNFAAMMRMLSFFTCAEVKIGRLTQVRKAGEVGRFADDLDDYRQIKQLDRYRDIELIAPIGYGCYRGPAVTLISSDTASVSEIFADAMAQRPQSKVWGWPSAGDVVLAVWYDLPALGPGYSVSIPQAAYVNSRGRELEREGVRPSRELFYHFERARRGEDEWISEAARALR